MVRAYRPHLDELGITYPQYLVMLALWEKDQVEIGDVKKRTRIDGGALSLILKKLQTKEFIHFVKSEDDKRVKQVCLTQEGRELEAQAVPIPQKLACKLPDIPKQDIDDLVLTVDKILAKIVD